MEASEGQVLESGQIRFTSQPPPDELGDCGPIHDLAESLLFFFFFTYKKGRNDTNLLGLCCEE